MTLAATPTGGATLRCDHPGCGESLDAAERPEAPHEADVDVADAAHAAGWSLALARDLCPAHTAAPPAVAPLTCEEAGRLLRALDAAALEGASGEVPPPRPQHVVVEPPSEWDPYVWARWGSCCAPAASLGVALRRLVDARRHEVEADAAALAREADHLRVAARRAPVLDARAAAIRAALARVDAPALPGVR